MLKKTIHHTSTCDGSFFPSWCRKESFASVIPKIQDGGPVCGKIYKQFHFSMHSKTNHLSQLYLWWLILSVFISGSAFWLCHSKNPRWPTILAEKSINNFSLKCIKYKLLGEFRRLIAHSFCPNLENNSFIFLFFYWPTNK